MESTVTLTAPPPDVEEHPSNPTPFKSRIPEPVILAQMPPPYSVLVQEVRVHPVIASVCVVGIERYIPPPLFAEQAVNVQDVRDVVLVDSCAITIPPPYSVALQEEKVREESVRVEVVAEGREI